MDEHTRKDYAKYRIDKAKRCIRTAEINLADGDYEGAANRSYYAMFHSVRGLLALDGQEFKKHSAVIAYFRREYIKSGKFDVEMSDMLGDSFEARGSSDYDDFYVISKERVIQQIDNARNFVCRIEEYILNKEE
ncbi:MAG: HEPN domain-containing protein [Lachnospiraceae bacterium]|nr:HEPN domain-containing protein [Lachnospiraceae bacterium]